MLMWCILRFCLKKSEKKIFLSALLSKKFRASAAGPGERSEKAAVSAGPGKRAQQRRKKKSLGQKQPLTPAAKSSLRNRPNLPLYAV